MPQVNLIGDSLTSSRASALRAGIRRTYTPWIIHYLAGVPNADFGMSIFILTTDHQPESVCWPVLAVLRRPSNLAALTLSCDQIMHAD